MKKQNFAKQVEPELEESHHYFQKNVTESRSRGCAGTNDSESVAYTFNLMPNFNLSSSSYAHRPPGTTSQLRPIQYGNSSATMDQNYNCSTTNIQPKEKVTNDPQVGYQGGTQPQVPNSIYGSKPVYPCALFSNNGGSNATRPMVSNEANPAQEGNNSMQKGGTHHAHISNPGINTNQAILSAIRSSEGSMAHNFCQGQPVQRCYLQSREVNPQSDTGESWPGFPFKSMSSEQCSNHRQESSSSWHRQANPLCTTTSVSAASTSCTNNLTQIANPNLPVAPKLNQISKINQSAASNINENHISKTLTPSSRNGSPTVSSTNTNKNLPDNDGAIIDVEAEDIEDCMLVSIDLSKQMSLIGSKIHNSQVVIDSDEDEPVVTSTEKRNSNQVQQGHKSKEETKLPTEASKTQAFKAGLQNTTKQMISSSHSVLTNTLSSSSTQPVQDKDIEVYIDQDIKEESLQIDIGVTSQTVQNSDYLHEDLPPPISSSDEHGVAAMKRKGHIDLTCSDTVSTARSNFTKALNKEAQQIIPTDFMSVPKTACASKTMQVSKNNKNPRSKAVLSVSSMLNIWKKNIVNDYTKAADQTRISTAEDAPSSSDDQLGSDLHEAGPACTAQSISVASNLSSEERAQDTELEIKMEPSEESHINSSVCMDEQITALSLDSSESNNANHSKTSNNIDNHSAENSLGSSSQVEERFNSSADFELKCSKCKRTFLSSSLMREHLKSSVSCRTYTDKLLSQHKPTGKDVLCCVSCHHTSKSIDEKFQHVVGKNVCFQSYASLCISCNAKVNFSSNQDRFEQTRTCRKKHLLGPSIEENKSIDQIRTKQNTGLLLMSAGVATLNSVNPPTSCTVRCEGCSSWFSSYARFKLHVRAHPPCKKYYDDRYSSQRDMDSGSVQKEKSANKPNILCPVCSKKFATNAMLTIHLNENTSCRSKFLKSSAPKVAKRGGNHESAKADSRLPNTNLHTAVDKDNSEICSTSDVQKSKKFNLKEIVIKLSPKSTMCTSCHKAFLDSEALSKHLSSAPSCNKQSENVHFQCKGCKKYYIGDEGLAKHIQKSYLCQSKMDSITTPSSSNAEATISISSETNKRQKKTSPKVQRVQVLNVDVNDKQSKTLPEVIRPHEGFESQEIPNSILQANVSGIEKDELHEIADEFSCEESDAEGSTSTSSDEADVEYRCKTCNEVFTQKQFFKQHMRQHRQGPGQKTGQPVKKIKCGSCRKKMKSHKDYQAHLLKKSFCFLKVTKQFWYKKEGNVLSCKMCNKVLKSLHDLGRHCFKNMTCRLCYVDAVLKINSWTGPPVSLFEESKNSDQVSSSGLVSEPSSKILQERHASFECMQCHIVFETSFQFQLHFFNKKPDCLEHYARLKSELQAQVPYCFRCKNRFINTHKLQTHKCVGYRRYVRACGYCGFKFPSLVALEAHAQNDENCAKALESQTQVKCNSYSQKPKEVARKSTFSNLKVAQQSNEKSDINSSKTQRDSRCSLHGALNAGKGLNSSPAKSCKEFSCRVCFRKFNILSLLLEHSYEHTEEKQYNCKRCGFICYRYNRLVSHEAVHERLDKECGHYDDRLDLQSVMVPDSGNSDHETNASDGDACVQEESDQHHKHVCNKCGVHFECDRGLRKHLSCSKSCRMSMLSFESKKQESLSFADSQSDDKKSVPTLKPSIKIVSKIGSSGKRYLTATPVEQVPREDHLYCFFCHRFLISKEDVERHAVYKRHALLSRRILRKAVWSPTNYSCKICKVSFVQKGSLVKHMLKKHNEGTSSLLKVLPTLTTGSLHTSVIKPNPIGRIFCILCKNFIATNKKKIHFTTHINELMTETKSSSALNLQHPSKETCKICQLTQASRRGLLKHLERHREDDMFSSHSNFGSGKTHSSQLPCVSQSGHRLKPRSTPGHCKLCHKKFLNFGVFKRHFKLAHSKKYSKPALLYYVKDPEKLQNLVKKTINVSTLPPKKKDSQLEIKLVAKVCNQERKFNSSSHFVKARKLARMHRLKNNQFFCKICNWASVRKTKVNNHIRKHHQDYLPSSAQPLLNEHDRFVCIICNVSFESLKGFSIHFANKHEEKDKLNSLCGFGLTDSSLDLEPGFSFKKKRVLHCKLCNSKVKAILYGKHLMMRHGWLKGNLHPCSYCKVDFPNKEDLCNHRLQCEKDCCCRKCEKQLNSLQGLRNHIIGFHKLLWDKYASETFNLDEKYVATSELNVASGQKNTSLKCTLCEENFEETGIYLKHMKTHLITCKVNLGVKIEPLHKDLHEEISDVTDSCTDYESYSTSVASENNFSGATSKEAEQIIENKSRLQDIILSENGTNNKESVANKTKATCLKDNEVQVLKEDQEFQRVSLKEIGLDCMVVNTKDFANENCSLSDSLTNSNAHLSILIDTIPAERSTGYDCEPSKGSNAVEEKNTTQKETLKGMSVNCEVTEGTKNFININEPSLLDHSLSYNSRLKTSPPVNNKVCHVASESSSSLLSVPSKRLSDEDHIRANCIHNQAPKDDIVYNCKGNEPTREKHDNLHTNTELSKNSKRKAPDTNWSESDMTFEKRKKTENNSSDNLQGTILENSKLHKPNTVTVKSSVSPPHSSKVLCAEKDVLPQGFQVTKGNIQDMPSSASEPTANANLLVNIKTEKLDPYIYSESRNLFTDLNDSVNLVDNEDEDLLFVSYHKPTLDDYVRPRSPINVVQNMTKAFDSFERKDDNSCTDSSNVPNSDALPSSSSPDACNTRNVFDMLNK